MKVHLAVEPIIANTRWTAMSFIRCAEPVDEVNADLSAVPLSLASEGYLYPRLDRSEGSQEASAATLARGPLVEPGDLVVNPMWLTGGGIAVSEVAGVVSPDYRVYRLDRSVVHPRFAHYLLRSRPYRDQYRLYTRADTTFDRRVSRTIFHSLPIALPPLDTQRRIANMLDAETARIDRLIESTNLAVRLLYTRRQALVTTAVTGEPSESGQFDTHRLRMPAPSRRARVPLTYLADIRPSGVDKHTADGEQPVRLCNYTDVYYNERITSDLDFMEATATPGEVERFTLHLGDIAITKDSETADDIGIPAIVTEPLEDLVLGYHNALIRPRPKAVEPRFLFWALASRAAAAYWETKARGVTRVGLRSDDVAALPIPRPDRETQRRIADMLDEETARIDALIEKKGQLKDVLEKRRQALVTAAVTGEIEV